METIRCGRTLQSYLQPPFSERSRECGGTDAEGCERGHGALLSGNCNCNCRTVLGQRHADKQHPPPNEWAPPHTLRRALSAKFWLSRPVSGFTSEECGWDPWGLSDMHKKDHTPILTEKPSFTLSA